ncbi:Delta(24)-sterol reductase [Daldinia childiae]|uniref:Delta(24)-sterol reductase n=1 Tax=Daldinia childiae TaxID=326645 RepID=UPI0014470DE5|nr:Delta(24)-sterol reductase [Daldinia childiae]KAF3061777.1 Delta(24)-sterol reductase [Daldinia childiae]
MEHHRQAVRLVSATVRSLFERSEPYRIWHGSTNSTRPPHQKAGVRVVDISGLRNVLSVDAAARTALVEPNVPMDRLVESTLPHGLVPPIVMEFPGITAGAGSRAPPARAVVSATGTLTRRSGPWRWFSRTGRSLPRVRTRGTNGRVAWRRRLARFGRCAAEKGNDYVDGILFSKDHGVIVSGKMTDDLPSEDERVQTFSHPRDPWFYLHVQDITKTLSSSSSSPESSSSESTVTEYIPLSEYLFRYDRGGFWVGKAAFDFFNPVPFNRFFRWFLDDFMHTRMLYRALHGSGESARFIVQDVGMPYESAEPFINYVSDELAIWPLWLCPLKTPSGPSFHPHLRDGGKGKEKAAHGEMLNIGVWGWGPSDRNLFIRANRALERRIDELGGTKWLYAHTYYPPSEFWRVYGSAQQKQYEALRQKYLATSLPNVYDKVSVKVDNDDAVLRGWKPWLKALWPIGGLWGIWKAIQSKDYLLHRRATWKWTGEAGEAKTGKAKST